MLLFLKNPSFNSNFIFNDFFLFMITGFNEEYFRNNLIFLFEIKKLNDFN